MVKFSILVAVYNAEKYIDRCLKSLIGQSLKEIQIICVDDASIDRSVEILRQYESFDSRIEIYCLPVNHGPAYARNVALKHVQGKYVAFLDSDDWLDSDALEKAVEVFEKFPKKDHQFRKKSYLAVKMIFDFILSVASPVS